MSLPRVISIAAALILTAATAAPDRLTLHLSDSVTLDLIAIPGTPRQYWALTPVTVRQFRAFVDATGYRTDGENPVGNGPGHIGGHGWNPERHRFEGWWPQYTWRHPGWPLLEEHPVSNVSWNDATAFCKWLSAKSGHTVRLPIDDEFERSSHAGTTTKYFSGDSPASLEGYANVGDRSARRAINESETEGDVFPFDDGYPFTSPVASFKPNPWGLYDMLGNVFEWCSVKGRPTVCGCSYNGGPAYCLEKPFERHAEVYSRYAYFGFRVLVEDAR
ncbi:MAG TPA: SUMF1/EgtB/PvdO family nonheme iron enzyme [Candidatus Solibacter sp.]|nr:SUMF1/EgtB/PvdO family nonheme iron enzyme [Candidatus Solibacter sp.]